MTDTAMADLPTLCSKNSCVDLVYSHMKYRCSWTIKNDIPSKLKTSKQNMLKLKFCTRMD